MKNTLKTSKFVKNKPNKNSVQSKTYFPLMELYFETLEGKNNNKTISQH